MARIDAPEESRFYALPLDTDLAGYMGQNICMMKHDGRILVRLAGAKAIAQYTGPASHDPEDPFDEYDAAYSGGFDVFYDEPIKIGSLKGRMVASFNPKKPNGRNRYIVFYKVGRDTFVQIRSKLDFDEDLSLILETIHIEKQ